MSRASQGYSVLSREYSKWTIIVYEEQKVHTKCLICVNLCELDG